MLLAATFSQALNISLNFNICESLILRFGSPEDKILACEEVMPEGEHTPFCLPHCNCLSVCPYTR